MLTTLGALLAGAVWGWLGAHVALRSERPGSVRNVTGLGLATFALCAQWQAVTGPGSVFALVLAAGGGVAAHVRLRRSIRSAIRRG